MKPYLSCLIGQVGGPSEVLPLSRQGDKQWWLGSHAITIYCESRSQVHREGTLTCWEPLSVFCSISSLLTLSYGASCFFFLSFFLMARTLLWFSFCCDLEEYWSGSWGSWDLFKTLPLICSELGWSVSFVWVSSYRSGVGSREQTQVPSGSR